MRERSKRAQEGTFARRIEQRRESRTGRAAGKVSWAAEERLKLAKPMREQLVKAFPEHWSFMLGEIALYALIITILTGTYLTFFYDPSDAKTFYDGSYHLLKGISVSKAYSSTLDISFDVRGGLLIRQIHHWAAEIFIAGIFIHMCRIFFTGAFRKPREMNWIIGLTMLGLAIFEGYCGYSLPDDLLSGTGLRIGFSITQSIPVVGTWLAYLIWGGPYPGDDIFQRLYIAHVLLFPGLIVALVAAHLTIMVRQKHTDFAGAGRTERAVAGEPLYPIYAAKTGGFFFLLGAALAVLGGFAQINPIWLWGPYDPAKTSTNMQPDYFMWWVEGSLRTFPPWSVRESVNVPVVFWAAVFIPALMFLVPYVYPWLEKWVTKDHARHNILQRPRDAPGRTALGAGALTFATVLSFAATDDVDAMIFHLPIEELIWFYRISALILPFIVGFITNRVCHRLQEHDRLMLRQGVGTGQVRRLPDGTWGEVTRQVNDIGSGKPETVPYRVERPVAAPGDGNGTGIRGKTFGSKGRRVKAE